MKPAVAAAALCAVAMTAASAELHDLTPSPYACAMLIQWDPHAPRAPAVSVQGEPGCGGGARMALLQAQLALSCGARCTGGGQ